MDLTPVAYGCADARPTPLKSPAIEVYVDCRLICLRLQSGVEIAGTGGRGLNPQPQILVLGQVPMTSQPQRPLSLICF